MVAPLPQKMRKRLRWVVELGLLAAVYWGVSSWQSGGLLPKGTPVPELKLYTLQDEQVSLESFRGKRVLLHFWATWCGVCRREHAALNAIQEGLGPDEVLLSVVLDAQQREPVELAIAEGEIRYPVLLGTKQVQQDFRVSAFPTNYFVDPEGEVSAATVGMSTRWGLNARLGCAR